MNKFFFGLYAWLQLYIPSENFCKLKMEYQKIGNFFFLKPFNPFSDLNQKASLYIFHCSQGYV